MKTKLYYYIPFNPNILEFLEKNHITYKREWTQYPSLNGQCGRKEEYLQFTFNKENIIWGDVERDLPHRNACWLVFTPKELNEAKWLTVRTTNMKVDDWGESTFQYSCRFEIDHGHRIAEAAHHHEQVAPYECRPIKWKPNNHFYSPYRGGYETIFCDDFAMQFMQNNALKGVEFGEITWYKKNIPLPDAHQLLFPNVVPKEYIEIGDYAKKLACPMCGRERYEVSAEFRLRIKKEYLDENVDFYRTADIFGSARESHILIASQRAYSKLKEAGLTRNLCFEPVILV